MDTEANDHIDGVTINDMPHAEHTFSEGMASECVPCEGVMD